jgi:hypothetical protein
MPSTYRCFLGGEYHREIGCALWLPCCRHPDMARPLTLANLPTLRDNDFAWRSYALECFYLLEGDRLSDRSCDCLAQYRAHGPSIVFDQSLRPYPTGRGLAAWASNTGSISRFRNKLARGAKGLMLRLSLCRGSFLLRVFIPHRTLELCEPTENKQLHISSA